MTQSARDKQQAPISKNHVQRKPGGDPGGRYAVQLRAMSFEEGEQLHFRVGLLGRGCATFTFKCRLRMLLLDKYSPL